MPNDVDLSIVIASWNAQEVTAACIDSIVTHLFDLRYEILLVDNGSSDGSVERFRENAHVKLIANNANLGFAKANNIGLRHAAGMTFLLLNNDTVIVDDSIQKSFEFLRNHPTVGVMGCRLLNPDHTLQRSCSRFPRVLTSLFGRQAVARAIKRMRPRSEFPLSSAYLDEDHLHELRPDWIMGAFMMIRREAVDAAGLLDEDYFMYAEDMDWCYRIKRSGWEIAYSPNSSIIHLGGESSRTVPEATLRRHLASFILFFRKHHPENLHAAIAVQYLSLIIELIVRLGMTPFSGLQNRDERHNTQYKLRFFHQEIRRAMHQQLTKVSSLACRLIQL